MKREVYDLAGRREVYPSTYLRYWIASGLQQELEAEERGEEVPREMLAETDALVGQK